jgi:hypothetical protein
VLEYQEKLRDFEIKDEMKQLEINNLKITNQELEEKAKELKLAITSQNKSVLDHLVKAELGNQQITSQQVQEKDQIIQSLNEKIEYFRQQLEKEKELRVMKQQENEELERMYAGFQYQVDGGERKVPSL